MREAGTEVSLISKNSKFSGSVSIIVFYIPPVPKFVVTCGVSVCGCAGREALDMPPPQDGSAHLQNPDDEDLEGFSKAFQSLYVLNHVSATGSAL